jgi:hypothetical protein
MIGTTTALTLVVTRKRKPLMSISTKPREIVQPANDNVGPCLWALRDCLHDVLQQIRNVPENLTRDCVPVVQSPTFIVIREGEKERVVLEWSNKEKRRLVSLDDHLLDEMVKVLFDAVSLLIPTDGMESARKVAAGVQQYFAVPETEDEDAARLEQEASERVQLIAATAKAAEVAHASGHDRFTEPLLEALMTLLHDTDSLFGCRPRLRQVG